MTVLVSTAIVALPASASSPPKVKIGQPAFYSAACADSWNAVRWYRARYDKHRQVMGLTLAPRVETGMACKRLRERAAYWVGAAKANRLAVVVWAHTIHPRSEWLQATHEVQKAFPGTERWLLSCSSSEGGHGRWVIYGGGSYYPRAEYSHNGSLPQVGGPMQYMWDTFKGHYRHGLDSLRSRGFHVNLPPVSDVAAWRSMTAQAIAAGWARWSGNDDQHWSASWNTGCA